MDNTDDIVQVGDVTIIERNMGFGWFKGTNYNYHGDARYPVPALLSVCQWSDCPNGQCVFGIPVSECPYCL